MANRSAMLRRRRGALVLAVAITLSGPTAAFAQTSVPSTLTTLVFPADGETPGTAPSPETPGEGTPVVPSPGEPGTEVPGGNNPGTTPGTNPGTNPGTTPVNPNPPVVTPPKPAPPAVQPPAVQPPAVQPPPVVEAPAGEQPNPDYGQEPAPEENPEEPQEQEEAPAQPEETPTPSPTPTPSKTATPTPTPTPSVSTPTPSKTETAVVSGKESSSGGPRNQLLIQVLTVLGLSTIGIFYFRMLKSRGPARGRRTTGTAGGQS